ncbi:histidine kinase dimerization/phospho-acceptor domain-containing protein [Virgibacillus flavescens]|uniref:sensor histidine kinase n=1 Tax=Virgibacillus flavescens TaxID=1611422 RepID=UPI003D33D029
MKKYSHSIITKIVVLIIAVLCVMGIMKSFINGEIVNDGDFSSVVDDHYFESRSFVQESENLIGTLTTLIEEYKNEEYIKSGGTIDEDEWKDEEENLLLDYQHHSNSYNPALSREKNYETFKQEYAAEISQAKDRMIQEDLEDFYFLMQRLEDYEAPLFYASDGENVFSNTKLTDKEQFKSYPSYMIAEDYQREFFPNKVEQNEYLYRITDHLNELNPENTVMYLAFTEETLNAQIEEWESNKAIATKNLYYIAWFLLGFILSFVYLVLVTGRKSFKDHDVHLYAANKLYNDINIAACIFLILLWGTWMAEVSNKIDLFFFPITFPIVTIGLLLILSLVKHVKNKTLIKHTLFFSIIYTLVKFVGDVYRSGSTGVKTVLIVIGYPLLIALTFFIFPITIGIAAWFAYKKVKSFKALQDGVETIKDGNIHHRIEVNGKGEFAGLASDINSITDGLKKAVDNELKSERLKTELITNVSHDIRTPLTSIITYVDLLKNDKDSAKTDGYIEVLDRKSKRLKLLTDDLFEAAKATSGNIPVSLEKIDIVSLITQGLGEVNDKVAVMDLDFKVNHPNEKVYVTADGKLLWRSIENLLSNIFNYALEGSRVYIDIVDLGDEILITFKNISATELNITADELMERFKRGDESRTSQGSGLGLSIAGNLIEIQKGKFDIHVDGDLFKARIYLPKHQSSNE